MYNSSFYVCFICVGKLTFYLGEASTLKQKSHQIFASLLLSSHPKQQISTYFHCV